MAVYESLIYLTKKWLSWLSMNFQNSTQEEKCREVLTRVINSTHSDFYRKKYGEELSLAEAVSRGATAWQELPFLSRAEIQEPPFGERLFVPYDEVDMIRPTSGLSGNAVMLSPRLKKETSTSSLLRQTTMLREDPPAPSYKNLYPTRILVNSYEATPPPI